MMVHQCSKETSEKVSRFLRRLHNKELKASKLFPLICWSHTQSDSAHYNQRRYQKTIFSGDFSKPCSFSMSFWSLFNGEDTNLPPIEAWVVFELQKHRTNFLILNVIITAMMIMTIINDYDDHDEMMWYCIRSTIL